MIRKHKQVEYEEEPNVEYEKHYTTGVMTESDDINKWEMETEPWLDKIYYRLIGYVEDQQGKWVRDEKLPQLMNERGASAFIHELRMRVPINMQMSELTEYDIRQMVGETCKSYSRLCADNYEEWGIKPSKSQLYSLGYQLKHVLHTFLYIAKDGGMKRHREARGVKSIFNPPGQSGVY